MIDIRRVFTQVEHIHHEFGPRAATARSGQRRNLVVIMASEEEMTAHAHVLNLIDKASRGNTVWRRP